MIVSVPVDEDHIRYAFITLNHLKVKMMTYIMPGGKKNFQFNLGEMSY